MTNREILKILNMEINIMINLKKWFDIMRTDSVITQQVESYREELNYINLVISKLNNDRKNRISQNDEEEILLLRKRKTL